MSNVVNEKFYKISTKYFILQKHIFLKNICIYNIKKCLAGPVASATISQNSENFGPLLYFELVSSFLDFSLLIFGLWILKRLPTLWVTVNRLVLAHFSVLMNLILSGMRHRLACLSKPCSIGS